MMKKSTHWQLWLYLGIIVIYANLFISCKMEEIAALESTKDIQGTWRIVNATRNGTDITDKFDFTPFKITFGNDGNYTIQHPLPFIVSKDGTYALDDPQYPFRITLKETASEEGQSSSFDYPIVDGKRSLSLTFSAGCSSNTYSYTLSKDEQ